jgi:hypothetical protein
MPCNLRLHVQEGIVEVVRDPFSNWEDFEANFYFARFTAMTGLASSFTANLLPGYVAALHNLKEPVFNLEELNCDRTKCRAKSSGE